MGPPLQTLAESPPSHIYIDFVLGRMRVSRDFAAERLDCKEDETNGARLSSYVLSTKFCIKVELPALDELAVRESSAFSISSVIFCVDCFSGGPWLHFFGILATSKAFVVT